MNIYQNNYLELIYENDKSMITGTWLPASQNMSEDEIRLQSENLIKLLSQYDFRYYLADDRQRLFVYNVELQNWIANEITKVLIKSKVDKLAILLPTELITSLSTDQTVDELDTTSPFETNFFDNPKDAMNWFGIL